MSTKLNDVVKREVERLVANWGYWNAVKDAPRRIDEGGMPAGGATWEGPRIPILYGDAEETDQVMAQLACPRFRKLRRVLELQFIYKPPVNQRYLELRMRQRTYYRFADAAAAEFWARLRRLRGKGIDPVAKKRIVSATVA